MLSDYYAATELIKYYPNRFRVLRYEDFTRNVINATERIFEDFFQLPFHSCIENYILDHINVVPEKQHNLFNTFRDTKNQWRHWIKELPFDNVQDIQNECRTAMQLWGYKEVKTEAEYENDFYPVQEYDSTELRVISL